MTPEQSSPLDLRRIGQVLRQRMVLIVVIVLGAFAVAFVLSSLRPEVYTARSVVQVGNVDTASILESVTQSRESDRLVLNQVVVIESAEMRRNLEEALGAERASQLGGLRATQVEETDAVRIWVDASTAEVARDAANTVALLYLERREEEIVSTLRGTAERQRASARELDQQLALILQRLAGTDLSEEERRRLQADVEVLEAQRREFSASALQLENAAELQTDHARIVDEATLPPRPSEPQPLRDASVAAVLGLVSVLGFVVLKEWLDGRVNLPDQAERLTGLPVIASIPLAGPHKRGLRRSLDSQRRILKRLSPEAESFGALQMGLRFSAIGREKHAVAVTSAGGGEGKTTIAANLAVAMAESGLRVVVVSADLRRPMIGSVFGVDESRHGVSSVLLGEVPLADALVPVTLESGKSLYLLPAGPLPANPVELLASDAFGAMVRRIKDAGVDFILLDCAPVLPVSDTLSLSAHVDGFVFLALAGRTRERGLLEAVERLQQIEAEIIGLVLNGVSYGRAQYGSYGYSAAYGYGARSTATEDPVDAEPASRETAEQGAPPPSSNGGTTGNGQNLPQAPPVRGEPEGVPGSVGRESPSDAGREA